MNRQQLEHVLRASAAITGTDTFVVIGSQAILGQHPAPPPELLVSMEADVFTLRDPKDADLIEGSIGEGSPFHSTFGYHAHGIAAETAVLPAGWQGRLVPFRSPNTGGATGMCLEVHDLTVSKIVAGREKDLAYIAALFRHGIASPTTVRERLGATQLTPEVRRLCEERLSRLSAGR